MGNAARWTGVCRDGLVPYCPTAFSCDRETESDSQKQQRWLIGLWMSLFSWHIWHLVIQIFGTYRNQPMYFGNSSNDVVIIVPAKSWCFLLQKVMFLRHLILGKQPLKYNCQFLQIQETHTAEIISLTYPQLSLSDFCQRWVSHGLKVQ